MNKCLYCKQLLDTPEVYGLHQDCFAQSFGLSHPTEIQELDPKKRSSAPSPTEIQKSTNTFFHGRYKKYSAKLGTVSYILKVQEDSFPELPHIEYTCNQMAEKLGIDVPPYHLINFNGKITFVTRNFMQDHIGSLTHIYRYLPPDDKNYNCETLIKVILEKTGKLSEVAKFIEICLFDTLIGNNDRHGRNLGIIETASTNKLAPMYDNPSCLGTEEKYFLVSDINPSGSIFTEKNKSPKTQDYIDEFSRLSYKDIVLNFRSKINAQLPHLLSLIQNAELSLERKNAFTKLIEKRAQVFNNAQ